VSQAGVARQAVRAVKRGVVVGILQWREMAERGMAAVQAQANGIVGSPPTEVLEMAECIWVNQWRGREDGRWQVL